MAEISDANYFLETFGKPAADIVKCEDYGSDSDNDTTYTEWTPVRGRRSVTRFVAKDVSQSTDSRLKKPVSKRIGFTSVDHFLRQCGEMVELYEKFSTDNCKIYCVKNNKD